MNPRPTQLQPLHFDLGHGVSVRIMAHVVDTPEAIAQGLAGRDSLPKDEGMLFAFPDRAVNAMTMLGMRFPLDMIFLDGTQVVGILSRCKPGDPRPFLVPLLTTAVLEVNAGFAERHGIRGGSFLQ